MQYDSVVQLVLIYRIDSWVVMGFILKVLEVFHHRLARRIMGMIARRTTSGEWKWLLVFEALDTAGLWLIE